VSLSVAVALFAGAPGRAAVHALASVVAQTREAAEIVVVDGGTQPLLEERLALARRGRTVRMLRPASGTRAAALNQALALTAQDVVVVLDADDRLLSGYLAAVTDALTARPDAAFVSAACRVLEPTFGEVERRPVLEEAWLFARPGAVPRPTAVRREAWEAAGGFDESLPEYEDHDLWIRLLATGARGLVLPDVLLERVPSWGARDAAVRTDEVWMATRKPLLEKHRPRLAVIPSRLIRETERHVQELRERHLKLHQRREALRDERAALQRELASLPAPPRTPVWGELRRTSPFDTDWGIGRGVPLDRHYIESFLAAHHADVRGAVLEVQEPDYTVRFGAGAVSESHVLDRDHANPKADVLADLRDARSIRSESYDCFILTQTVHVIDDVRAALAEAVRILKPGGVLLLTLPCASRACLEYGRAGDFWRVTEAGARDLVLELFAPDQVTVRAVGNVLASAAFLYGLAVHEVSAEEYAVADPLNPLLVTVRAVKTVPRPTGAEGTPAIAARDAEAAGGLVLLYHRVTDVRPDTHGLATPPAVFAAQMAELARLARPMPLLELVEGARAGSLPPGAVAVTFDDGYVDALTEAAPVLTQLGIPATFFVNTASLVEPREFWWDALERALVIPAATPPRLDLDLRGRTVRLATATAQERVRAHTTIHRELVDATLAERGSIVAEIVRWSGVGERMDPRHRPLTGDEIRRLAALPGCSIGAHTENHLALTAQPADVQRREIGGSRAVLERWLGAPVYAFAYPYGAYVFPETPTLVEQAGFRAAVTCDEGRVGRTSDPFRIPRVEVGVSERDALARMLRGSAVGAG
jgi:peptidoglycan/xylan/chitin deacetylase (PgdA/CDA1 family)